MKKHIILILCFLFLCQFCSEKYKDSSYKIEMIDGVKVVLNFKIDSTEAFKDLKFVEDLSIGMEEGDENYMFTYPADVESDNDGNIYVLDYRECVVKKYNPQGKFLKQFGRRGQGPGEFQGPYCMNISHQNRIYVRDGNKIEVFSLEGDYQKTISVDVLSFFYINKNNELIIDHRTYDKDGNGYHNVGRFSFQNNKFEPFLSQRQYWPSRTMDDEFIYEFPYYIRWGINSKDHIYAASAVNYEISVFDSSGRLLFRFNKDFKHIPVTGEEMKKILDISSRGPSMGDPNPYKVKLVYPVFKYISIDENDRVWVEHCQPIWTNKANKETIYDVFSSDGIFLFTTIIPGHIYPQLVFKNGYIYALKKFDTGYTKAMRIRIDEKINSIQK